MDDSHTTVAELKEAVGRFAAERAWEPFHSPKNLVMGLAVEAAELMEHFLWVDCEASRALGQNESRRGDIVDEVADVACHLFNLCNALQLDLSQAVRAKMVKNAQKYPVEKYKGKFEV
ncbi:MAG TPA: nucleotide pyrophosphohydrolase [Gemmataceae bacterium]|nr:nucleotide pyrophosphohydrolase [Gemmataceae bacterium]